MQCPNCGSPERARVRECTNCGTSYTSADLLEYRQLEYLLAETESWPGVVKLRKTYAARLAELKNSMLPQEAIQTKSAVAQAPVPAAKSKPKAESVPFDQWLLSEKNIKFALYSGGILLILAGLIFVGVNWTRISGPGKFAITLMVTGLMYLGGFTLFQRPMLKVGGITLLGIASGFVPLNFVVLQIYIFSARGLSSNMMWFVGSIPTLLLYILTTYWTRSSLFTYLSLGALLSGVTAALVLLESPILVFVLIYTILALIFLLAARVIGNTRFADYTKAPLFLVSQIATPILLLVGAVLWTGVN